MCIICVQLQQQKLTIKEAWNNYLELADDMDEKHRQETYDLIYAEMEKEKNSRFPYEAHSED